MKTKTGEIPIGFRRGGGWQSDIDAVLTWAVKNDFEVLDVGCDDDTVTKKIVGEGLHIGSIDLPCWPDMICSDSGRQKDAVARCIEHIGKFAAAGRINYFAVMIPADKTLPRKENFKLMVDSYSQLIPVLEEYGARIVVEGWPGPGVICCTPEGYRALFSEITSESMGINYDPSHLIRMGIDPIRFLDEFCHRVYHVHGKDTEICDDKQYEFGTEQPPTFAESVRFGGMHWRYTIPGRGRMEWSKAFQMLSERGYDGAVSIELEDADFNGTEEGEKQGLLLAGEYLSGC